MSISICLQEELQSIVEAEMWPGAPAESSLPSHSNTNTTRLQQRRALEGCPRVPVSSFFSPTDPTTLAMAFMAMRKNLDERAKKKELDAIFAKFDHNHNGNIYILIPQPVRSLILNCFLQREDLHQRLPGRAEGSRHRHF